MKIQFTECTWVLKRTSGQDFYYDNVEAIEVLPEIFEVKSINKSKTKQCSDIYIGNDGYIPGNHYHLINVPNGLFKQVNDNEII